MKDTSLRRYTGEAVFAGIALALALATALLAGIGTWAWLEFRDQAARYRSYRDLQANAGRADSLSAAYATLLQDLEALKQALPAQNQSSHVLNVLVETARNQSLAISGITALDEVPFPGFAELPFELGLTGSFVDLVRYLYSLESRGMAVEVRRLSAKSESLNRSRIQARLELSVFVPAGSRGAPAPMAPPAAVPDSQVPEKQP